MVTTDETPKLGTAPTERRLDDSFVVRDSSYVGVRLRDTLEKYGVLLVPVGPFGERSPRDQVESRQGSDRKSDWYRSLRETRRSGSYISTKDTNDKNVVPSKRTRDVRRVYRDRSRDIIQERQFNHHTKDKRVGLRLTTSGGKTPDIRGTRTRRGTPETTLKKSETV